MAVPASVLNGACKSQFKLVNSSARLVLLNSPLLLCSTRSNEGEKPVAFGMDGSCDELKGDKSGWFLKSCQMLFKSMDD